MSKLYIVIPAYNEEMNIKTVAREWHEVVQKAGSDSQLVIIDDGSKDHTFDILCSLKTELPQMIPLTKSNSGHGATVLFGYQYALKNEADFIFQTDSDGQTLSAEFAAFWERRNEYDAIIGYRNHRKDGWSRIFVTKTLKFVLWCIFKVKITDANTPFRLMSKTLLMKHIQKIPENFNLPNVLLTVSFVKNQENIKFFPITFRKRQGGVNSINFKRIVRLGKQALKDFKRIRESI